MTHFTELPPEQIAEHVPNARPGHRIFASDTQPPRYVLSEVFLHPAESEMRSFDAEGVWGDLGLLNASLTSLDADPEGALGGAAFDANFSDGNVRDHHVEMEINHPGLLDPMLHAVVRTMFEQSMGKPA